MSHNYRRAQHPVARDYEIMFHLHPGEIWRTLLFQYEIINNQPEGFWTGWNVLAVVCFGRTYNKTVSSKAIYFDYCHSGTTGEVEELSTIDSHNYILCKVPIDKYRYIPIALMTNETLVLASPLKQPKRTTNNAAALKPFISMNESLLNTR
jgi:hypothetical protein